MKVAIMKGFVCGHFDDRVEEDVPDDSKLEVNLNGEGYCPRCNDFLKLKRINIFVLERDVEVT